MAWKLFDRIVPVHLANEARLLSALRPDEQQTLADLLRRLNASFEVRTTDVAASLGLTLEPAHLARARRQSVGLSDVPGLLVVGVEPHSPAAAAGIERGDLLTEMDGAAVISSTGLAVQLEGLADRRSVRIEILRGDDPVSARLLLAAPTPGH